MKVERKATCHPDIKHYAKGLCKTCFNRSPERRAASRVTRLKNNDVYNFKARHKYHAMPADKRYLMARNYELKTKYGISLDDFNNMFAKQNYCCAICLKSENHRAFNVDHCHTTGKVRGIVCNLCNVYLGFIDKDINTLNRLTDYVKRNK